MSQPVAQPVAPFWLSTFLDFAADDFERGVRFWAGVTGYGVSPRRGDAGEFATLVAPDGDDYLRVQRRGGGPSGLHLDLHVLDPRAAADRALVLGAVEEADHGYVVLRSPAGLTFCFVSHPASRLPAPVSWPGGRSQVDQVALDIGPDLHDAELAFWAALTGFASSATTSAEFNRLDGVAMPLRLLIHRLDAPRRARFHLDVAVDDREAEVARHTALGAERTALGRTWSVLTDPTGLEYCITDRPVRPRSGAA